MTLGSFQKTVRTVGLIAIVFVALGGVVFLGRNATTYFARAAECPAKGVATAQVTSNSAVITWETDEITQGRVQYGTSATNLAFSAPEPASGRTHNVPMTLLTPNTVYYYTVKIGNTQCDSTGKPCEDGSCIPWNFSTQAPNVDAPPVETIVSPTRRPQLTQQPTPSTTSASLAPPQQASRSATPGLSAYCKTLRTHLGATDKTSTSWAKVKEYDLDTNGIINGQDMLRCIQSNK